jgi:hypothetical protein
MSMLSKAIMAPRDLLRDTRQAQRICLLFDRVLIWPLDRIQVDKDEAERTEAELDFLREHGVVLKVGHHFPPLFSFGSADGTSWSPNDVTSKNCDIVLPFAALTASNAVAAAFDYECDRVVYGIAKQLTYGKAPVSAYAMPKNMADGNPSVPVALRVTLSNIPMPAENMPWEDFLQFRANPDTSARLRALRLWLQKRGTEVESESTLQDELETLLHDYRAHMNVQKIKHGDSVISTIVTATADVISHLTSFNFGSALKSVLDLRQHNIALTEAELKAPGREVSFIAKAQDFLRN